MTTMIERVALALHQASDKPEIRVAGMNLNAWDALLPNEKRLFREAARAALEALRHPTPEMLLAAEWDSLAQDAAGVWREMIGAALRE